MCTPPGRSLLCRATGTKSPTWTFCAPVTICTGSALPSSTMQTHIWSEFSCRAIDRTLPTTTFLISASIRVTVSTFWPARVRTSAYSLSVASISTNSFNHFLEIFIL